MQKNIPVYNIQNFETYKHDGILVHRFASYAKQNQHLFKAHKHSFYHLVFFTNGTGMQQIDFESFKIQPNQIYFMVPGQVHNWKFDTEPDGYLINFSTNYFSNLLLRQDYLSQFAFFNGTPGHQVINLERHLSDKLAYIFEDILKEGENGINNNDDLIKILLLQIFTLVKRSHSEKIELQNPYNHTILNNFRQLIETNYKDIRLPKDYAKLLYITPNHLNALCNDFLGTSAGRLIRDRVILEAKRLLVNLDLRVVEIAEKLNFEDQSYFVKFFKKYEGTTPDKFRKQYITQQYGNTER